MFAIDFLESLQEHYEVGDGRIHAFRGRGGEDVSVTDDARLSGFNSKCVFAWVYVCVSCVRMYGCVCMWGGEWMGGGFQGAMVRKTCLKSNNYCSNMDVFLLLIILASSIQSSEGRWEAQVGPKTPKNWGDSNSFSHIIKFSSYTAASKSLLKS